MYRACQCLFTVALVFFSDGMKNYYYDKQRFDIQYSPNSLISDIAIYCLLRQCFDTSALATQTRSFETFKHVPLV